MPDHPVSNSTSSSDGSAYSLLTSIARSLSLYTIALIAQRTASLILFPIVQQFLAPADFGVLELIEQTGTVVSVLAGVGLTGALGFFYFEKNSPHSRQAIIGTALFGSCLLGVFAASALALVAAPLGGSLFRTPSHTRYLYYLAAALPFTFVLEAAFSWLRVEDRIKQYASASMLRVCLIIAGTLMLVVWLGYGVLGVLLANILAIVLLAAGLAWYCWSSVRPVFHFSLFVRMLKFSAPLILTGLAQFVMHFGDRFILPTYRSFTEIGLYSLAYKIAMLISFVNASFQNYWSAQAFQIVQREDANIVMGRIFTYMVLVLAFCWLGFVVFALPVLRLVARPAFHPAAGFVPLLATAYLLRAVGDFFRVLFTVESKPGCDTICNWIGSAVCLAGYALLIPAYGAQGAAIATLGCFLIIAVIAIPWTFQLHPYRLEGVRLAKIAAAAGTLAALYFLVPVTSMPAQFAWAATLSLAFPMLLWAAGFLTPGEHVLAARLSGQAANLLPGVLRR